MAVILKPQSGDDMMINWWNWRPTIAVLVRAGVLPAGEREDRCLANGCGGSLSFNEALKAADCVESLVADMEAEERVLLDGTITKQPINFGLLISEWDEQEIWNRHSAQCDVLKEFAEFCRRSGGFEVI